ncbi:MAG: preprotein translocase subunit SecE [Lautropia sp.]|nr:preprotein translocase subunit SecE [Lautropia sp.]
MAAQHKVEDLASGGDRIKVILAILIVLAGVVGFYLLREQALVFRVLSVIGGLLVGGLVAWTSVPGRRALAFMRESWQEARRVVWPSKKETWSVTLYVFLFVVIMAVFLWLVDSGLQYLLYDLVLGWSR